MTLIKIQADSQIQIDMKGTIPAFNIVLSLIYLIVAGIMMYLLKRKSHNHRSSLSRQVTSQHISYKIIAMSWFKKYSLFGLMYISDLKYLLKECLIISIYAATCFNINQITLWPVTFVLFMLPLIVILYEVLLRIAKEKVKKNISEPMIQNEIIVDRHAEVNTNNSQKEEQKSCLNQSSLEAVLGAVICFTGTILFLHCMTFLQHSVSNSGILNIESLLIIICIDQVLIRPSFGLLIFACVSLLEKQQKINIESNAFLNQLCLQELLEITKQEENKRENKQKTIIKSDEISASPLKKQADQASKENMRQSQEEVFFDLNHLTPAKSNIQRQESEEDPCMYLTTAERVMFDFEAEEEIHSSYIQSLYEDKENYSIPVNREAAAEEIKDFDDVVLGSPELKKFQEKAKSKNPLDELLDSDLSDMIRTRHHKKRPQRRVLKITGDSPYLQYLPNMLKNVQKPRRATKDFRQSKML